MKTNLKFVSIAISLLISTSSFAGENWKGHTETSPVEIGAITGLSLYGTQTAWAFLVTGAYLIQPKGWLTDIDNRVWLEMEAGPAFFPSSDGFIGTPFEYSAHLRWDFTYNEFWTFYGLGGISGYSFRNFQGNTFSAHPRFGVGAEYQTKSPLMFRGELSAEFMGVGIALNF